MICTTIQNRSLEEIFEIIERPEIEMAEIRLDRCDLTGDEIGELFEGADIPLVATCRISSTMDAAEAEARLLKAVQSGAAYVDIEIEAPSMMSKRIRREAGEYGTVLIRSWHDFEGTDSPEALRALAEKCLHLGAGIAKIVTTAHSQDDVARVMSLYDKFEPGTLLAFCMGEEGKESRLECLRRGAPYTYAAMNAEEAAAPGQWPAEEIYRAVYGDRTPAGGELLTMPSSKSFAQRAIVAASMASGVSTLSGYTPCGDSESAIAAMKSLGAEIARKDDVLTVKGIAAAPKCSDISEIHTGESGFLTRMTAPLLAVIGRGPVRITGEKSLIGRPLKGAREIMGAFGAVISTEDGAASVGVPFSVKGPLRTGHTEISGKDGSQLVSGLMAALPLEDGDSEVYIDSPKSIPYLFITMDVLKKFGIRISSEMEGGEEFIQTRDWGLCDGINVKIKGGQRYAPAEMRIEADWSSAAPFMVAGAIFGGADLAGLDTSSLQADLSVMDILAQAGASISQEDESGIIHVRKAPLTGFDTDASNCPDLFHVIAVLAAFCEGTSRISGVGRLASKESDRGRAITEMLTAMGVHAAIKGDVLEISGMPLARRILLGRLLKGGRYTSSRDHRMVMALEIASLGADAPIEIDDTACVAKSFPDFMSMFDKFRN